MPGDDCSQDSKRCKKMQNLAKRLHGEHVSFHAFVPAAMVDEEQAVPEHAGAGDAGDVEEMCPTCSHHGGSRSDDDMGGGMMRHRPPMDP
jgi:hypothetical protein